VPVYYGRDIARASLREIGVIDPIEPGSDELIADTLNVGTDLIDGWRLERLTIPSITRSVYNLATTQTYTLGSGGTFDQDYPQAILAWSIIPDPGVAQPLEIPMGRPLTWAQWQAIRQKAQTGAYPTALYWDKAYAAHLGTISVHPIPTSATPDLVLYQAIPSMTALVAGTQYDLRPGYAEAIKTNLAIRLCPRHGKTVDADLRDTAKFTKGRLKRGNINPLECGIRGEFLIGTGADHRTFNVYTGTA